MKKMFIIGCVPCILLVSGCGFSSSPKEVLTKFLTAMEHSDFKEAKKYATADSQSFLDMISSNTYGSAEVFKGQNLLVTDNISINGGEAEVEVISGAGATGVSFYLEKEQGRWKVSYNASSLFNTTLDAIKKAGKDVKKDVNKALDSLKAGLDSIR